MNQKPLASLASLARTPFSSRQQTRAKGAKDAKVKGIKHDEIAYARVESAFALNMQLAPELLRNWMTKRRISDRHSNPWRPLRPWREPLSVRETDSRQGRQGRQGQRQSGQGACPEWGSSKKKTGIFNGLRKPDTLPRVGAFSLGFSKCPGFFRSCHPPQPECLISSPIRLKLVPFGSMPFSLKRVYSDLQSKNRSAPSRYGI